MKIRIFFEQLKIMIENEIGVSRAAIFSLTTIVMVGMWLVFALSYYGGEIGLITHEEPRLAYLYCREEIKKELRLADNSLFDSYIDATIYTIQAHQYVVRLRMDIETTPGAQVDAYLPCTISAQPNGAWQIAELNFKP
jgi:hypothetical protein